MGARLGSSLGSLKLGGVGGMNLGEVALTARVNCPDFEPEVGIRTTRDCKLVPILLAF